MKDRILKERMKESWDEHLGYPKETVTTEEGKNKSSNKKIKGEITLLSLGQDPRELGLRYLSSILKENGYKINKLFLKTRFEKDISLKIVEQINEFAKNSLFIGVSIMTDFVILTKNFARKIKKLNKDVILVAGGIHPTARPDEITDVFDIAVRGEAEKSIVKLADALAAGNRIKDIKIPTINTKYYSSNKIGLTEDIENLPYPDFTDNFILKEGRIYLEKEYKNLFSRNYFILTSRGCPYKCTYCVNNFYLERVSSKFCRKRSISKIIDELKIAKEIYKIKDITFPSDNFLFFNKDEFEDFVSQYKKEVDLPFVCCVTPNCVEEERINKLMKIGLTQIEVGVQSGSENTLKLYKRTHGSPQHIVKAARILHKFYPRLKYTFDIILDNPYETKQDLKKTISLLEEIPKTYDLTLHSLTFYPATHLYDKAVKDGFIEESYYLRKSKYLHRVNKSFYNFIFLLYTLKVNSKLITYCMRCDSSKNIVARICKAIFTNSTDILLALLLVKVIIKSMRNKNINLVYHYIKVGFSVIKKKLVKD